MADAQRSERCGHLPVEVRLLSSAHARTWRNWYTRTLEVRIPQGLEVRVLSSAQMSVHKLDTKVYFGQKAFIEKNGKLLVLRDPDCVTDGQSGIDLPGGKYRWAQPLESELRREVKEETALEIEIGKPFHVWTYYGLKAKSGVSSHSVLVGYLCKYKSGEVKLSTEHDYFEWVDGKSYKKWKDKTQDYKALEAYFNLRALSSAG